MLTSDRRRTVYHLQWYCSIYDQIHVGFGTASVESIHGSILVVREALKHTGDFMVPRFKEVCTAIMRFQDSKHR
jgi:FKBP12-rapamycin complex-associated protein